MKKFFAKFIKEEDGATIIEYVLMLAAAAGIVMFLVPSLRSNIVNWTKSIFGNTEKGLGTEPPLECPTGQSPNADNTDCV